MPRTWGAVYGLFRLYGILYYSRSFHSLMLPDLTPNPGLWWYFFTEMFDHFRPFFLMVFSVRPSVKFKQIMPSWSYDIYQKGPSRDLHRPSDLQVTVRHYELEFIILRTEA